MNTTATSNTSSTSKKSSDLKLEPVDLRDITAAAAEAIDNTELAEQIAEIPDDAMQDALDEFKAENSDLLAAGREQAKNYKPGGSYS